jgi:pyruvate dehydrogenase E2 component (dihydrolipoamide acetyltransferase)
VEGIDRKPMTTPSTISLIEVLVPDLGDIKDVLVIEVLAKMGEQIAEDQTLAVLETEKATMDVPSTSAGIIRDVIVKVGDKVSVGSVLVIMETLGSEAEQLETVVAAPPPLSQTPPSQHAPAPKLNPVISASDPCERLPSSSDSLPHASPSVRRFARDFGLDLTKVHGSGPKGRILHTDLQAFVKAVVAHPEATPSITKSHALDLLPWPQVDFAKFGLIERTELSKIKKISGASLTRNAIVIPHVTNFDEADVTELEAFRVAVNDELAAKSTKLTMLAFLIKASVSVLKEHTAFNASLDGEHVVLKRYFHIGFAADTPNGLVVPVIRDADTKGLRAIAAEASTLAEQARSGKLKPTDMQGGCFTVSSLGGIGGTGFTPIINAPEVAILGAARASMKPVWNGEQFEPRLVMPLSLSWDHRVIDGAAAARFLIALGQLLADFRRVML